MRKLSNYPLPVTVILMLLLTQIIVGCGAKQYRRVEQTGYLEDYSEFVAGKGNEALYVYVNPQADCRKYTKVMIDKVVLMGKAKDSPLAAMELKDQKMLATLGWGTIYDAMRKGQFEIVSEPGADVIRVKAVITEADKAIVILADAMMVAPYVWEAATVWGIGTGKWPFLGELAGEIEISDSQTGERLFAAVDKVVGTIGSNMDPRAKWDDVRQGFERWRDLHGKRMASCRATGSFVMPADERSWMQKSFDYLSP